MPGTVAAVHAGAEVGRMERAAPAARDAGGPPGQFGEQPARVAALGQQVTVRTVMGQQDVVPTA